MAMSTRITDLPDWFPLWHEDKQAILDTMVRNLQADLNAGYDYFGNSATSQRQSIEAYKAQMDEEMKTFRTMTDSQVSHWCFYDMKRRGAIA